MLILLPSLLITDSYLFQIDSARFGLIGTLYTRRPVQKGEEIYSHYWYSLNTKHRFAHWYYDQWEEFKKNNPDSPMIEKMEEFSNRK